MEADPSNANENDNPRIEFSQDGGTVTAVLGLNGDVDDAFSGARANAMYMGTSTPTDLQLMTNNDPQITITPLGNVGINKLVPQATLDINGSLMYADGSQQNGYVLTSDAAGNATWQAPAGGSSLWTDNSPDVNYTAGNVGIGTNAATSKLDIARNASGQHSLTLRSGNPTGGFTSSQILFGFDNNAEYRHNIRTRHNSGGASDNAIDFYVWDDVNDAIGDIGTKHVMSLDGGNVGIGTTSPNAQLEATGSPAGFLATFDNTNTRSASAGLEVTTLGRDNALRIERNNGAAFNNMVDLIQSSPLDIQTTLNLQKVNTSANFMTCRDGGSVIQTVIDGNGHIGIGLAAPDRELHTIGDGEFSGNLWFDETSTHSIRVEDRTTAASGGSLIMRAANGGSGGFGVSGGSVQLIAGDAYNNGGSGNGGHILLRSGGNTLSADNPGDIIFETRVGINTSERMRIMGEGRVGIGTDNPSHGLHVESPGTDIPFAIFYRFENSVVGPFTSPDNIDIYCSGNMAATAFLALSDRRIKTDLAHSNSQEDLARLMQLKVTDYTHIDTVKYGSQRVKGFIAQEVKDVYPEAVRQKERFVPNVYSLCAMGENDGDTWTITLPTGTDMTDITAERKLQLILPDGKTEVEIVSINGRELTVSGERPDELEQVFVYGTWVDDFHVIDYDKLYTLGVSSIQQLYKDLQAEQQRNDQQQQQIEQLMQQMEALSAKINSAQPSNTADAQTQPVSMAK